jgi:parvulin-like peptidyl-prolyl isomerase
MNVKINRELLSKIQVDSKKQEIDSFLKDTKPLVEVNGGTLTVGEFIKLTVSSPGKSADDILNNWIDRKLIDIEALSRHYEKGKDLRELIRRYENQILKNTFIKRVIVPQITVTDEDLKEYYTKNQAEFLKPSQYKIQQIKVKTIEEAREIENSLRNGADFSWIAKRKSIDSATSKGGNAVWVTKKELAEPLINIIDTLSIGEISPVTQVDSHYSIIKIQDKKVEEIEKFEKVKNAVYTATFNKNLKEIIEKYVNQLKQDVKIRIYEDAISSLEEQLQE